MNNTSFTKAIKKNEQKFGVYVKPHPSIILNCIEVTVTYLKSKKSEPIKDLVSFREKTDSFCDKDLSTTGFCRENERNPI
ncbi:hypothetical protein [Leptospira paudalimensis]|uniref:Uncharacterized protein n=1 Tax=Leptospira paudalimensis TaxID=2950024 RepID=A0ABT3M697_9LEPT|nr:hypothetical protein [Leptospira paudalimensis]MCW7503910.1 hypothetical protein [Leptospira paudalimensis]